MSESDRVQRWRQRQREEGKEPMTIWLSQQAKYRLEDLARVWRSSPAEMLEQALAQFPPGSPSVPGTVADTEQLRVLIQEVLVESQTVTVLVTDTVTATLARDLPALVRATIQDLQPSLTPQQEVAHPEMSAASITVTNSNATATPLHGSPTEPAPQRKGGRPRSAIGQQILALLQDHPDGLSAEQIRGYLTPDKPIGDILSGMKRLGRVQTRGQGKAMRYFVAAHQ